METLARLLINRNVAWFTVIVVFLLTAISLTLARRVKQEDDLLAFLPQDNPDIRAFYEINKRFGGLDIALVGIASDDPLRADFLEQLRRVTRALREIPGLRHVLSLTNVVDFQPDEEHGGIITGPLVDRLPRSTAEQKTLREKIMSQDLVVGNLIAPDGKGILLYCFLGYGANPREVAAQIQRTVENAFPQQPKYWGGNPFISTYIYNTTQQDLRRLTPWAALAIIIIIMVAFRDLSATLLALFSTGIGVVISLGLMAALDIPFNIVLGSMPVVMLALGSAYAIHVLARYHALAHSCSPKVALVKTLVNIGPTILAAGLTTVASLLSFVFMDIQPLRIFGLFTAIGLLVMLGLSLVFIPAVILLWAPKPKSTSSEWLPRLMSRLAVFSCRRRTPVAIGLGLLAALCLGWIGQVDSRLDQRSFFSPGSPPDLAETYLREHFGGSQFIQIQLTGDLTDPDILRELQYLADEIALLGHVSSVLHIGQAISQVNEAMTGQQRIPQTTEQVKLLYSFLSSDPSVAQLVSADRRQALLQIKIDSSRPDDYEQVLAEVERVVEHHPVPHYQKITVSGPQRLVARRHQEKMVLSRIRAAARVLGHPLTDLAQRRITQLLHAPLAAPPRRPIEEAILHFLRSEECAVEIPPVAGAPDRRPAVASALVQLGPAPGDRAIATSLASTLDRPADDELIQDLVLSIATPLQEIWTSATSRHQASRIAQQAKLSFPRAKQQRFLSALAWALLDLQASRVIIPDRSASATFTLGLDISGLPVLNRGLSRSVTANQLKSLCFSLSLVLVIMTLLLRSLKSGLLVSSPVILTLLVIYGGMGLLHIRLDIGTSMLASIILGAGVDYGLHLAAAWYAPPGSPLTEAASRAAQRTGLAIWTNAIMVSAGFFILTLGEAKPLKNVGGLTGAAMLVAALATFFAIPALARKSYYRPSSVTEDLEHESETVEAVPDKVSG